MTDGAALIAACRALPDDDSPRLQYCDWLEERGQEARAEWIRLGIELFRTAPPLIECSQLSVVPVKTLTTTGDRLVGWRIEATIDEASMFQHEGRMDRVDLVMGRTALPRRKRDIYRNVVLNQIDESQGFNPRFRTVRIRGNSFIEPPNRIDELRERERELLDEHGIDVLLGEPAYQWDYWTPRVSRGMVEAMTMPAEAWIAFADKYLLTIQPIRDVYLETLPVLYMRSTGRERVGGSETFVSTLEETSLIYQSGSNDDWAIAEPAMKERWPDITFHYAIPARNLRAGMLMGGVSATGNYSGARIAMQQFEHAIARRMPSRERHA